MLNEANALPRKIAQARVKLTACIGCGVSVEYRTNPRVNCPQCKISRKLESSRLAMERQRRKKGIVQVKGTQIVCCICHRPFERATFRSKYCRQCSPDHYSEKARAFAKAKYATREGKDYNNAWAKAKRASDPAYGVHMHMSVLMHRALRGKKQGRRWKSFVPYSLTELMVHLERQFLPGMTWENRGRGWHIDHIQSRSSFEFVGPDDPEFKACWALSNLRPLWKGDNLRKNARRTLLL